jgi:hypothetical protein
LEIFKCFGSGSDSGSGYGSGSRSGPYLAKFFKKMFTKPYFLTSVADPTCHVDADPSFHFAANLDPDPSFQIKAQNLEKVFK